MFIFYGVGFDEVLVKLCQFECNGYMIVKGIICVGKMCMLEFNVIQDIYVGYVMVVVDLKGDVDLMFCMYVEVVCVGCLDQFYIFYFGYFEIFVCYNGIGNFFCIIEVVSCVINVLFFVGNLVVFKEFSWCFSNLVVQVQVVFGCVLIYEMLFSDIMSIDVLFVDYVQLVFMRVEVVGQVKGWKDKVDGFVDCILGDKKFLVLCVLVD